MSVDHSGARERLRERFLRAGLDDFSDLRVLELLLGYVIPRRETNSIAHALLDRFGTFADVLDAPMEALREIDGVGENAAAFLKLLPQLDRRYRMSRAEVEYVHSSADAGRILLPRYRYARQEIVYLLSLDTKNAVIGCDEIGRGALAEANVTVRAVVEAALRRNAAGAILSHNHVDGIALPSKADLEATKLIAQGLWFVGVTLADHIVVGGDDFVSLADSGLMPPESETAYAPGASSPRQRRG